MSNETLNTIEAIAVCLLVPITIWMWSKHAWLEKISYDAGYQDAANGYEWNASLGAKNPMRNGRKIE